MSVDEYLHALNHERIACDADDGREFAIYIIKDVVGRVDRGVVTIDDVFEHIGGVPSVDHAGATLIIRSLDGAQMIDQVAQIPMLLGDGGEASASQFVASWVVAIGALIADRIQVVDAQSGVVLAERIASLNVPSGTFTNVQPGATLTNGLQVTWAVSDQDRGQLDTLLFYSWDNGVTWVPIDVGRGEASSVLLDTSAMPGSAPKAGRLLLKASDGFHTTDVQVANLSLPNKKASEVAILSPRDDQTWREGVGFILTAAAVDIEDAGSLDGAAVQWSSSLDGPLGSGRTLYVPGLSVGSHEMCVEATDSDDMTSAACVTLVVAATTPPPSCCTSGLRIDGSRIAHPGGPP